MEKASCWSVLVIKGGKAFIFLGKSGDGKSTIADLSRRYNVIGDDVVAVRKLGGSFKAFSTPWRQRKSIRVVKSARARVSAVFFLNKSNRIHFSPLKKEEALSRILNWHIHFLIYTKRPVIDNIFSTAAEFVKAIPAYDMEFSKRSDFWKALEEEIDAR